MAPAEAEALCTALSECRLRDRKEEMEVLVQILKDGAGQDRGRLVREILRHLKSFAHKKYRVEFEAAFAELSSFAKEGGWTGVLESGLTAMEETARKRFGFMPDAEARRTGPAPSPR
jgi:hypothetical protein